MISFSLDDLLDGALRKAAVELGIPITSTTTKAELIYEIKKKVSPDAPLSVTPSSSKSEIRWWKTPSIIISIISLLITIASLAVAYRAASTAWDKIKHEYEDEIKENWQELKVYVIISQKTMAAEKWMGLTFDEIKSFYTEDVVSELSVKVGKEELQPAELRRILLRQRHGNTIPVPLAELRDSIWARLWNESIVRQWSETHSLLTGHRVGKRQ